MCDESVNFSTLTPRVLKTGICLHWVLKQSDYVVTYITHTWGGAYQYAEKAKKQGKIVVNLTD